MAEPSNIDEALEAYQNDKFSRKSLFVFVVNELKAIRREHEELKNRVTDYVVGRPMKAPASPYPSIGFTAGVPEGTVVQVPEGTIEAIAKAQAPRASEANKEAARERMKKYWADKKAAAEAAKAAPAVQEAAANG